MPKFAANLSMLFDDAPFLDRFERAARAGFDAVEFQFPYAWRVAEIQARLTANGLRAVLHNLPPGDWEAGDRGLACLPGRTDAFRRSVALGIETACALGVPRLNCLVGRVPAGADDAAVRRTLVANLRFAAREFEHAGLQLLVEPINPFDVPGYGVTTTAQALSLLDEVGAANAFVQYDIYHAQRVEGEIAATLARHLARIAHVQIADNPGRHEPGTGELHWDFLFAHLDRIGYRGHVGCEYRPAGLTEDGLGWLRGWTG